MPSPVGAPYSGLKPQSGLPSGEYSSPTPPSGGSGLPVYSSAANYPGAAATAATILAVAGGSSSNKVPSGYPRSGKPSEESPSHPFANSPEMVSGTAKTPASSTVSPRTTPSHVPASLISAETGTFFNGYLGTSTNVSHI